MKTATIIVFNLLASETFVSYAEAISGIRIRQGGGGMTITRGHLSAAIAMQVGLSQQDSRELLDMILDKIAEELIAGDDVKIQSFGTFSVRNKNQRTGRNPKTGASVPIEPRRTLSFKASGILKDKVR